jgi:predicted nucleic acid-binding protein
MPELLSPRLVVSNSTPIIALALIGQLDLLQKLYRQVIIPPTVEAEILAGGQRAGQESYPEHPIFKPCPCLTRVGPTC